MHRSCDCVKATEQNKEHFGPTHDAHPGQKHPTLLQSYTNWYGKNCQRLFKFSITLSILCREHQAAAPQTKRARTPTPEISHATHYATTETHAASPSCTPDASSETPRYRPGTGTRRRRRTVSASEGSPTTRATTRPSWGSPTGSAWTRKSDPVPACENPRRTSRRCWQTR